MTTDQDLRDLLATEADGPTRPPVAWDEIVRRGRHHRRVTRARRGLAAGALAAAVAIGGLALVSNGTDQDRDKVIVDQPDAPVKVPMGFGPWLMGARARGATLTIITTGSDPATGWNPCVGYRPRIIETATRVVVELVDGGDPEAIPWETCRASEDDATADTGWDGSAWGSIELDVPLGDRPLVDGYTDQEVLVDAGTPLLFPTYLPEPLRVDRWSNEGSYCGRECYLGGWTFTFIEGDLGLVVTAQRPEDGEANQPCRYADQQPHPMGGLRPLGEPVAVRGTTGTLCSPTEGTYYLSFVEDGVTYGLGLGHAGLAGPGAPFTERDIIAIADGLEPFEE